MCYSCFTLFTRAPFLKSWNNGLGPVPAFSPDLSHYLPWSWPQGKECNPEPFFLWCQEFTLGHQPAWGGELVR